MAIFLEIGQKSEQILGLLSKSEIDKHSLEIPTNLAKNSGKAVILIRTLDLGLGSDQDVPFPKNFHAKTSRD